MVRKVARAGLIDMHRGSIANICIYNNSRIVLQLDPQFINQYQTWSYPYYLDIAQETKQA